MIYRLKQIYDSIKVKKEKPIEISMGFSILSSVLHDESIHFLQPRPGVFKEAFVSGTEVIFVGGVCSDRFPMAAAAVSAQAEPLALFTLFRDLHGPLDEAGGLTLQFHFLEAVGGDVA